MPNHVENHLIFDCPQERFQEILRAVCYEPGADAERTGIGTFDFNKLIPMPDHIYRGNLGQEERKLYGKDNWYDWSISHWGTKWNSYSNDCDENSHTLSFQTAWAPPFPIIERLAERYPDVRFTHEWADEDMGYNVGTVEYADGEIAGEDIPDGGSVEAFRMALRVWDYDEEDFGMCENAAHTRFIRMDDEEYEPVDLFGKIMLFSNSRLTEEDIPNGWHLYHLRQNPDTGRFATIEPNVRVDHAGSIVSKESIDFGERDYIELNDETDPNFLGGTLTFEEYSHLDVFDIDGYLNEDEGMTQV